jgi:hypothetical protein
MDKNSKADRSALESNTLRRAAADMERQAVELGFEPFSKGHDAPWPLKQLYERLNDLACRWHRPAIQSLLSKLNRSQLKDAIHEFRAESKKRDAGPGRPAGLPVNGRALKQLRSELRLTQFALATKCGVSEDSIRRGEGNHVLSEDILNRIVVFARAQLLRDITLSSLIRSR